MPTALAVKEKVQGKIPPAIQSLTPQQLRHAVETEADRRIIIRDFVKSQLIADKDYGTIDLKTRSGGTAQSKPVLFKSGMEKIFSLLGVVSTLERDGDTIEMVGKPGVIAYKCILTRNKVFLGEGRGAAEVSEKGRVNDAIKIAEKRARMDACLNLGFSEYFTQDLEDRPIEEEQEAPAPVAKPPQLAYAGWKNGEVRDLTFAIKDKEMRSAQNGTVYAMLYTDLGVIKAWKNTFDRLEVGRTYRAAVEASEWNGTISLAVVRLYGAEE